MSWFGRRRDSVLHWKIRRLKAENVKLRKQISQMARPNTRAGKGHGDS